MAVKGVSGPILSAPLLGGRVLVLAPERHGRGAGAQLVRSLPAPRLGDITELQIATLPIVEPVGEGFSDADAFCTYPRSGEQGDL